MRVEERLERAVAPDAVAARERARRVVRSAPVAAPRRRRRRRLAALLALALAVGIAPAGSAIASWLADLVDRRPAAAPTPAPAPEPRLKALRAPGRVLVTGPRGAWAIAGDASRVRIGDYHAVAWSPRGVFVAAAAGDELRAVEADGTVRWSVDAHGTVRDPVWAPSGFRVAYRVGDRQRIVAGDGTADGPLVAGVASVAPAWRPADGHQLALARRDGAVELWSADARVRVWRVRSGSPPVALLWQGARRLVIVGRDTVEVVGAGGRRRGSVPVDGPVTAAAPLGRGVALASGTTVSVLPLRRGDAVRPRARLTAAGPVSDLVASPTASMLIVASARAGQWVLLPARRSGRVSAASVEGVTRVAGWQTEPLASAPMGDGRQVVLTPLGRACLVISGVDEFDRQCVVPPRRRPGRSDPLVTGPVAQKSASAPVEVYGTVSEAVDRVVVAYVLGGLPAAEDAVLLRAGRPGALRRAGASHPFGVFLAELPPHARTPIATAYDASGRRLMRDGFPAMHPHAFIGTAGPGDIPEYDATPWARIDVTVDPAVGDGTTREVHLAFTSTRRRGFFRPERWRYRAVASTTTPAAGCVNRRDRVFRPPPAGRRVATALRLADGEGGDTRWCPGRYRGRVVLRAPGVREIVARFGFRVLP